MKMNSLRAIVLRIFASCMTISAGLTGSETPAVFLLVDDA